MAGPGNILITVGADTVAAVRNLGNVNSALGDTMTTSEKMSAGIKKAAVPAAAALAAIGYAGLGAAKAAMEDAQSADHLAQTMKRVTGATDKTVASVEDYIDKTARATGVADDKLRPAFEKLVTSTGDVHKAQELLNKSLDISAATGKDVDTVSTAVAKAYQGQTASLSRLVPGISEASRTSKDFTTIMDELADKTGGAAAKAADTAAGKMARFEVATGELQESIGYALLPVIEAVIPVMLQMANFAEDNVTVIKILVAVVASLAGGILAANVALKAYEAAQVAIKVATGAWTAAQWLLNAALDANPIGVATVAIAALVAGIVIAYNKSETFRDIVHGALHVVEVAVDSLRDAFAALQRAATAAFEWITDHWKLALFAFGPIGAAIYVLVTRWDQVRSAAQEAWNTIVGAVDAIGDAFGRMEDRIGAAVRGALGWLDDLVNKIDGAIGWVRDLLDWIDKIHIPSLPGGFHIPSPFGASAALAGVPAPRAFGRAAAPSSSLAPVTINVYGAIDPEGTARYIDRLLERHRRRQGWIP